jgi:hypothetical protein
MENSAKKSASWRGKWIREERKNEARNMMVDTFFGGHLKIERSG